RAKDAYLMEHSMNVAILLANFGRYLGLERSVLKELTLGGLLHDVGKIMTPDEVLHKPGKLTDEEFAIMRQHVVHSYE
ncbi:HD domain-containing protein, partial [Shewanella sp. C31]|nr:HD domain-containing protein [Shewanella electrica]